MQQPRGEEAWRPRFATQTVYRPSAGRRVRSMLGATSAILIPTLLVAIPACLLVSALSVPIFPWMEPLYFSVWRSHSSEFYLTGAQERRRVLRVCMHGSVALLYTADCKNALYAETAAGDEALQSRIEREARQYWRRR